MGRLSSTLRRTALAYEHPVTGTVAVHTTGVLSATGACSTDWALPPIRRTGP